MHQTDYMSHHASIRRWQQTAYLCIVIRVNIVDNVLWKWYCTYCHNSLKRNGQMMAMIKNIYLTYIDRHVCSLNERPPENPGKSSFSCNQPVNDHSAEFLHKAQCIYTNNRFKLFQNTCTCIWDYLGQTEVTNARAIVLGVQTVWKIIKYFLIMTSQVHYKLNYYKTT